jgi:hypothetical protein
MLVEDLDATYVLAFLGFLAAFAAGQELSQMTVKRKRTNPPPWPIDRKVGLSILAALLIVLALMYFLGSPGPT